MVVVLLKSYDVGGEKHTSVWRRVLKSLLASHSVKKKKKKSLFEIPASTVSLWQLLELFASRLDGNSWSLEGLPGKLYRIAALCHRWEEMLKWKEKGTN